MSASDGKGTSTPSTTSYQVHTACPRDQAMIPAPPSSQDVGPLTDRRAADRQISPAASVTTVSTMSTIAIVLRESGSATSNQTAKSAHIAIPAPSHRGADERVAASVTPPESPIRSLQGASWPPGCANG